MIPVHEFNYEQQRVQTVQAELQEQLQANAEKLATAEAETARIERSYGDTAKVNTLEIDDQMETNAAIQQQKQLVALSVENMAILKRRQRRLQRLSHSPYFGRIDLHDQHLTRTLYIGTGSLMDQTNDRFLIYDWRSPIAELYYTGGLGPSTYTTPNGAKTVNLIKKRQFRILQAQIKNVFDTNSTIGDDLLQTILGQPARQHMRHIVETIQQEQNAIIRDVTADALIVQGAAGSGKTAAVLQRVAYLLYHSQHDLQSEQLLMFSPNRLFAHYIAEVLPSLGEKNMRQLTFHDFISRRLQGLAVESSFTRFEYDQEHPQSKNLNLRYWFDQPDILTAANHYCKQLTTDQLCFNDLRLADGSVVFSEDDLQLLYMTLPPRLPALDKTVAFKNLIIRQLKRKVHRYQTSAAISRELEALSEEDYATWHQRYLARPRSNSERHFLQHQLALSHFQAVYDAILNDYFWDFDRQYLHFLNQLQVPVSMHPTHISRLNIVRQSFEHHRIALQDAPVYLYLRDQLSGHGENHSIRYLFIDEMQDYTLTQLAYLKHVFPQAKFTLLGDQAQSLFHPTTKWLTGLKQLFISQRVQHYELNHSYRSTEPITHLANALLPAQTNIYPFHRLGPLPRLITLTTTRDFNQALMQISTELTHLYGMVAIITRTQTEADQIYTHLQSDLPVHLLTHDSVRMEKGIMILPIYLAKGLEFDAVIAYNVSNKAYPDASSAGILYTIMTRAMHDLVLLSYGKPSPLLTKLNSDLYQPLTMSH